MDHIYMNTDTTGGPSPTCGQHCDGASSEGNRGQKMGKERWKLEIPSPYMPWNNLLLQKIPTAVPGFEATTSWSGQRRHLWSKEPD